MIDEVRKKITHTWLAWEKLAGYTAIVIHYFVVIHYFEYVISNKHYFILHLFSDSTSTPIHYILHLLFHLSQCLLFFLLVVGWASRLFFMFIILWLFVWANPLLPSYLLFLVFVSCPKFVTDVYYWEVSVRFCVYLLPSKSKVPRLSFEPEPNSNSRVARRALRVWAERFVCVNNREKRQ